MKSAQNMQNEKAISRWNRILKTDEKKQVIRKFMNMPGAWGTITNLVKPSQQHSLDVARRLIDLG